MYIAMYPQNPFVKVHGINCKITLPEGCEDILLIFKTKTSARKWFGRKVKLLEIKYRKKEKNGQPNPAH